MATTPVSQSKPNPLHGTPSSDAAPQSGTPKYLWQVNRQRPIWLRHMRRTELL